MSRAASSKDSHGVVRASLALAGVAAALCTAVPAPARAQSAWAQLGETYGALCPRTVLQMISGPRMSAALRAKPVDVLGVCSCTENAFKSDQRLRDYLSVDQATYSQRMAAEPVKSYVNARIMQSIWACLAPAIDASLGASSLESVASAPIPSQTSSTRWPGDV